MTILCLSHLFPNRFRPNFGVFVKERLKAVSKRINCKIIAPIPYFPGINLFNKYKDLDKVPKIEKFDDLSVLHPRYFLIPKFLKVCDGEFYYYSLNKFMSSLIKESNINLIDVHWLYPDGAAALKWAKKFNLKIIVTVRGYESLYYHYHDKKYSSIKRKISHILQYSNHIICVSSALKELIIRQYYINPDKISVIINGIDSLKFFYISKDKALRICKLNKKNKNILTVARFSYEKGLDLLIRAIALLNNKNIRLFLIGNGPLKNDLKKLSYELGVSHQIIFRGNINHSELCQWYNAADIFCLPSRWEGCPNVLIEALACGTPIVSTEVGAVPDIVKSTKLGLLVPPDDPEQLALMLNEALNKNWDHKFIAAVGARNTWDDVAEKVVSVFDRVLS